MYHSFLFFISGIVSFPCLFRECWDSAFPRQRSNFTQSNVPDLLRVSFVNGIYYSEADWNRVVTQLNNTFDCPVRPFYSPSTGSWAADFSTAGVQKFAKPNDLALAKNLTAHLKTLIAEIGPHGRVLHIAHSGGAILTYLAAKYHLTAQERQQLDVITFGGGHSLTRKYFNGRVVNYYSRGDPLIFIDNRANTLRHVPFSNSHWRNLSFGSVLRMFAKSTSPHIYSTNTFVSPLLSHSTNVTKVVELKHNSSFVFMSSCTTNPLVEHSMEGPTYRLALEREAKRLVRVKSELIESYRLHLTEKDRYASSSTNLAVVRVLRKRAAKFTGWRHFWSTPYASHKVYNLISLSNSWRNGAALIRSIWQPQSFLIESKSEEPDYFIALSA